MSKKKKKQKPKICVSGAAALDPCCPKIKEIGRELGREISRQDAILLTGATTGVPFYVTEGFKEEGGFSLGFSPASSKKQHVKSYNLPTEYLDVIVYTGFDYVGRNLILTKSADATIIACGRTGTLNEFTVSFETRTPIGVLENTGGIADHIESVLQEGYRPLTDVIFEKDPKKMVKKMISKVDHLS